MFTPPCARLATVLLIPLSLAGTGLPLRAQATGDTAETTIVQHPRPRALIWGVLGAVAGGLAGFGFSKGGKQAGSGMTVVGAAAGGLFGFFFGRQIDERRTVALHGAPPLRIPNEAVQLEGDPTALTVRNNQAAVGGSAGVQFFSAMDPRLLLIGKRASGLRGVDALSIAPGTGWLVIGSGSGLYLYPPGAGPGVLVQRAPVSAIAAADSRVFVGVGNRVEIVPVTADSARSWPGTELNSPVRDLALDEARPLIYASTDRELVSFHILGDSLVRMGAVPLPGASLHMTLAQGIAAVAMGEKGVALFDVTDPSQPTARGVWNGARFAYDVSIDGSRMYVAAGPEGVYVVDLSGDAPRTIGVARSLGFAAALVSHDHHTFILDRRGNALRRIISSY